MSAPRPAIQVTYDNVDISSDITKQLKSLTYRDKVTGEADELELELEDTDGLWRDTWYPNKGAKISAKIGYEGNLVDCGTFQIDEVELTGPPDTVYIRALSSFITSKMRTKNSKANENVTLRQLAEDIAKKHGLTLDDGSKTIKSGSLGLHKIKLERSTQYRETDLEYLKRIAYEYGFAFTIKGTLMVFYHIESLEKSEANLSLERIGVMSYSLKDTTNKTYKSAKARSHNHKTQELVSVDVDAEEQDATNGETYSETTQEDSIEIRLRAENKQQAEAKAKAALHRHNSCMQQGSMTVDGNPLLLAGSNFELSDMGKLSGKWHITESTHTITKAGGYTTDIEVKRIARFSSDGAATQQVAKATNRTAKGDITKEADSLKVLAASATKYGAIVDNMERYNMIYLLLINANSLVKQLYDKKYNKEAKQLQTNIEMLKTSRSQDNCIKFATVCGQIREELLRANK